MEACSFRELSVLSLGRLGRKDNGVSDGKALFILHLLKWYFMYHILSSQQPCEVKRSLTDEVVELQRSHLLLGHAARADP